MIKIYIHWQHRQDQYIVMAVDGETILYSDIVMSEVLELTLSMLKESFSSTHKEIKEYRRYI
ncbi:hypothetical protein CIL05_07170 [Virgibacillus profundi]|uniref:Uncharacterized protein n=1 Tax=Virgibacillus profundi TaxID=2024555 RepID=A0A2A2IE13_9BACI|nr:hypothetical protein [Virgibacillus profundi]PAV30241.1 hypothetical protein CIL05_07170 [Virgibacillus profundi]PXY54413.1 hypothetical protein CIT14_07255 [Virgibacillus profundi]